MLYSVAARANRPPVPHSLRAAPAAAQPSEPRVEPAQELGIPSVPVGVRLNIGHERDESVVRKTFPPETDFECWGWMSKKGGVRRNWLERFFHLDKAGVLTYYENCNTIGLKKGGSTKMRLVGFEAKGTIDLKEVIEIRMGTSPKKTDGELELVTAERTYRECRPSAHPLFCFLPLLLSCLG